MGRSSPQFSLMVKVALRLIFTKICVAVTGRGFAQPHHAPFMKGVGHVASQRSIIPVRDVTRIGFTLAAASRDRHAHLSAGISSAY